MEPQALSGAIQRSAGHVKTSTESKLRKKQKQNRKKGRKKVCEDRNRGVRIIKKNFYS